MYSHGDNLLQKETHQTKYLDDDSRKYLKEIRDKYNEWNKANETLKGPKSKPDANDGKILEERVRLFSEYKDFIDQQKYAEKFDSRSNLHSSVLEEFVYYLFRDLVADFSKNALIGKAHTFKDIFFMPSNYKEMVTSPNIKIEKKDHDFIIGVEILAEMKCKGQNTKENEIFHIPAIVIECKTYLDKTMLEGASASAEQLIGRNPHAIYIVVSEWLKLTGDVNLRKYHVDQIYVLRKQKNTDREFRFLESYEKNPIHLDVITHLYDYVRDYLILDWEGGVEYGLERGWLINKTS